MSTDLKYSKDNVTIHLEPFQVPSLKEQAIAHWEENLKRVKAMDWKKWRYESPTMRRAVIFNIVDDIYPHVGGNACPYCTRYNWSCRTKDGYTQCPLRQEPVPGGCCVAWLNVREALLTPWNKVQTVMAVKAMIEYIKERG